MACATILANGIEFLLFASSLFIITKAAAPSEIDEELAALEMMYEFPDSIDSRDYEFFEDKSEAWKLKWLPNFTKIK